MSKELTYSIYYTPNAISDIDAMDFTCWDKKVHIRFRDFNKEEIICGFEKKLTYLLSYLMNFSYLPKVIGMYEEKALVDNFLKTSDVFKIVSAISEHISGEPLKGIKLYKNYRKSVTTLEPFGAVTANCFPLKSTDGIIQQGSLATFLEILKVDLAEYLFNDNYMIVIRENKAINPNKKFINKSVKKSNRCRMSNLDIAELW